MSCGCGNNNPKPVGANAPLLVTAIDTSPPDLFRWPEVRESDPLVVSLRRRIQRAMAKHAAELTVLNKAVADDPKWVIGAGNFVPRALAALDAFRSSEGCNGLESMRACFKELNDNIAETVSPSTVAMLSASDVWKELSDIVEDETQTRLKLAPRWLACFGLALGLALAIAALIALFTAGFGGIGAGIIVIVLTTVFFWICMSKADSLFDGETGVLWCTALIVKSGFGAVDRYQKGKEVCLQCNEFGQCPEVGSSGTLRVVNTELPAEEANVEVAGRVDITIQFLGPCYLCPPGATKLGAG